MAAVFFIEQLVLSLGVSTSGLLIYKNSPKGNHVPALGASPRLVQVFLIGRWPALLAAIVIGKTLQKKPCI
jgi:hypothetical protein